MPANTNAAHCVGCGEPLESSATGAQCAACLLEMVAGSDPGFPPNTLIDDPETVSDEQILRTGVLPRFGDYQLIEEIARGGMGVVYRATQLSLKRPVAIKMILAGQLATPESIRRFLAEAEAAAKLDHPGIVPIYEVGEHETQHFFSMRLVEGGSLAARIDDFALPVDTDHAATAIRQLKIANLVLTVARAIEHAHQHGILHRDLKPANILLDKEDNPQLTDFGLAKLVGHEASGFTLTAAVLGSPSYMAPEQAIGRPEDVTILADIYGLGATLYQLLTRQVPFIAQTALATMQLVVHQDPQRPRTINPQVHPDLETIALHCMQKSPAARYQSAGEVAEELTRFIRGESIRARPVGLRERFWRWCRRNPIVASLLTMLACAITAGFAGVLWQWQRAEDTNIQLRASIDRSNWVELAAMTDRDENAEALAHLAERLKQDPHDWRAAMLAVSILDYRSFARPVCEPITHGDQFPFTRATFNSSGSHFLTAAADGTARVHDSTDGRETARMTHAGGVNWAEFSANDELLITASNDHTAKIWDVSSGALVASIPHDTAVTKAMFLGDSDDLVTATLEGSIRLFRMQSTKGESPATTSQLVEFDSDVIDFDLNSATMTLVSGAADGRTTVWNLADGTDVSPVVELPKTENLNRVLFSFDGQYVVANGSRVNCWQLKSRRSTFSGSSFPSFVPVVATDTNQLLTHTDRRAVQIIEMETGRQLSDKIHSPYQCFAAAFDPSSRLIATGGWDYSVAINKAFPTAPAVSPFRLSAVPLAIEFSPVGRQLLAVVGSQQYVTNDPPENAAVTLWEFRQPGIGREFVPEGWVGWTAVSPDDRYLAVAEGHALHLLDRNLRLIKTNHISDIAQGLSFSPDGRSLISATQDGEVTVYSSATGELVSGPIQMNATGRSIRLSHDGRMLALASRFGEVKLLNLETGVLSRHVLTHGGELNDATFSPDDRLLATASDDHTVKIWDVETAQLIHTLRHDYRVQACKFSPDGLRLVTGSNDFSAQMWSVRTAQPIGSPMRHRGEVGNASFSPDSTKVLTSARDGNARIWDAATGEPLVPWMMHTSALREANWSPDGRIIVTVDHDSLRVWDAQTGLPVGVQIRSPSISGIGYDSMGGRVPFFNDSSAVFWGQTAPRAQICDISRPPTPVPDWFPEFLQVTGGHRLDASGSPVPLSVSALLEARKNLQSRIRGAEYYLRRVADVYGSIEE